MSTRIRRKFSRIGTHFFIEEEISLDFLPIVMVIWDIYYELAFKERVIIKSKGLHKMSDLKEKFQSANNPLTDQEELLKNCLDHFIDAFAIYKAVFNQDGEIIDFQIQYVNNAACEFFNRSYEEIVGTNLLSACPEITTCFFKELCYVVKTGEPSQRIYEHYQIELYNVSFLNFPH